jgi:hypothetical protein
MSSTSANFPFTSAKANKRALRLLSRVQTRVMTYFRRRRHRWLAEEFGDCQTVIDVGGREGMWHTVAFSPTVTIVNPEPTATVQPGFEYVTGDGCALKFSDDSFDLAFSNSVIEHVGSFEDQKRFASEMIRVGRRVYCQTPNRWFPAEFHFLGLFVQWLPRNWFTYLVHRHFTLRGILGKPTREQSDELRNSIRLLSRRELEQIFPGCNIRTERFLGMAKSFVVWK